MLKKTVSIIIVSWNVKKYLQQLIDSIWKYYYKENVEVIVIDNASTDGTQDWLRAHHSAMSSWPRRGSVLRAIINNENSGFAYANNQGIKIANGEYILLLNPDTILQEGVLESMVDFLKNHNCCGVAGCKILNTDKTVQPSVRRFPTLISQVFILLKLHHILANIPALNKYFANAFDYNKTQEVDQVMGAFFMFPKKIIEIIALFDEKFYIWFEEVDFCKRVKDAGLKIYYVAEAEIIHYGGMSFKQKLSLEKQKIFNASLIYYFQKHHSQFSVLFLKFINPISLLLAYITELRNYKIKHLKIISPLKNGDRHKMKG